jgi:hypothetical protein
MVKLKLSKDVLYHKNIHKTRRPVDSWDGRLSSKVVVVDRRVISSEEECLPYLDLPKLAQASLHYTLSKLNPILSQTEIPNGPNLMLF